MKFQKYTILIAAFLVFQIAGQALAMGERPNHIKENCREEKNVFVKIDNRVFYVPTYKLGLQASGKSIENLCQSSESAPLKVDVIGLNANKLTISGYEQKFQFQLIIESSSTLRNSYKAFDQDIARDNKKIEDLPIKNGFYEYRGYYVPINPIRDLAGDNLVLSCSDRDTNFQCKLHFAWKEGLFVKIYSYPRSQMGLDAWKDIYPELLKYLDTLDKTSANIQ